MFISVLDLFKVGIGPSSSHTMGPMVAARQFRDKISAEMQGGLPSDWRIICDLKGSLAHTGIGHGTDNAIILGLNGYIPSELVDWELDELTARLKMRKSIFLDDGSSLVFEPERDIFFDKENVLTEHPNGMIFKLVDAQGDLRFSEIYFSIGGGFIKTMDEIVSIEAPINIIRDDQYPFPFDSAGQMLEMARAANKTIAEMKRDNEVSGKGDLRLANKDLNQRLGDIAKAMFDCIDRGLATEGTLPGGLGIVRRAKELKDKMAGAEGADNLIDLLCAYAMAVNEENAAGHCVVTAPTNGAAGVIPAVLYYFFKHEFEAFCQSAAESLENNVEGKSEERNEQKRLELIQNFLLTAGTIGGLIKHKSSISGAEVGCQGEVGSASAMAAAGLCALKGGTPEQIENAAEIALEHHLGMTCDPVQGLVQVPCIERNGFGAVKAYTAASLALKGSGRHFMPLDACIAAMKETGMAMSDKYKETALGGLAQSWTEC